MDDILRNVGNRHKDPVLTRIFGDQQAVASVHPAHDWRLILGQLLIIGQIIGHPDDVDGDDNEADDGKNRSRDSTPKGGPQDITQGEDLHFALWPLCPLVSL